jgi:hypothetical protein
VTAAPAEKGTLSCTDYSLKTNGASGKIACEWKGFDAYPGAGTTDVIFIDYGKVGTF